MRSQEVLETLQARLSDLVPVDSHSLESRDTSGVRQFPHAVLRFRIGGQELEASLMVLAQPNAARIREASLTVAERRKGFAIVVAPFLNAEARKTLRECGIAYIDLSGNVWIQSGAVLIEKEAKKNLFPHQARSRNPFADKASLILRYLLDKPGHTGRIREIADAVGLDPGYVSRMARVAIEAAYANMSASQGITLKNEKAVLQDWCTFYHWRRNRVEQYFCLLRSVEEATRVLGKVLGRQYDDYALTLHMGANLIEPHASYSTWHMYCINDRPLSRLTENLDLERVENGGNIIVMRPYYRHSVFYGSRRIRGFRVVSDLQLYLDLRHFPVRGLEAAETIYQKRLKYEIEAESEQG